MQDAHAEESNAATDAYRDEVLDRLRKIEERLGSVGRAIQPTFRRVQSSGTAQPQLASVSIPGFSAAISAFRAVIVVAIPPSATRCSLSNPISNPDRIL